MIFSKAENVPTYSVIFQVKKRCVKSFFCKSGQINLIIGGVFTEQSLGHKNRNTRIDVYYRLLFECCFATVNGKLIVKGQADRAAEDGGGEESSQVRLIHVILSLLWKCTKNTMCGRSETLRSGSHFPF